MISLILARMTPQDDIQTYLDMLEGMALESGWLKDEWGGQIQELLAKKAQLSARSLLPQIQSDPC